MKILVVGGCGYIGGYLVDLLKKNHKVTVYDNLLYESKFLKEVNFVYRDVRDTKLLKKIINKFDIIVWLAALVGDGACSINTKKTFEINTKSIKWLCENYKKGKIIFTSTCSIYGKNNSMINEDTKPNPLSAYAKSKLNAEKYIVSRKKNFLIIRLGTLFGIGDRFSRLRLDLVANILTTKSMKGETLQVFGGSQWRPLLHVKDVSYAIDFFIKKKINGTFNLAYKNFKIIEIAESIQKFNPNTKIRKVKQKFQDQRNYKIDNAKVKKTGWKNKYKLIDGIKEIYNIISDKRIKDINEDVYYNHKYLENKFK